MPSVNWLKFKLRKNDSASTTASVLLLLLSQSTLIRPGQFGLFFFPHLKTKSASKGSTSCASGELTRGLGRVGAYYANQPRCTLQAIASALTQSE